MKPINMDFPVISPEALSEMLLDQQELALLDVRENGTYSFGHLFFAVSTPLSHLELKLGALVPRRSVRVVLVDEGGLDDRALLAAQRMRSWGYQNIHLLAGGMQAWKAASLPVFSGVYVPSKAFGEFVEHECGTPSVSAQTLSEWMDNGKDMVILDSRPYGEYHAFSMPGAICCSGVELPYRAFGLVDSPETTIVINCAGRTRGIIGAQSLINAGISNPVFVLENGTAGWYLAGNALAHNQTRFASPPTQQAFAAAHEAAQEIERQFNISEIDASAVRRYQSDDSVSFFLLDVRTPQEYESGHLVGSRSAPGGQLIQSTDLYIGVKNAKVVLVDDNGIRARFTASWLMQMGWRDVEVMTIGDAAPHLDTEVGAQPFLPVTSIPDEVSHVSVVELQALIHDDECVILDLADSLTFRAGHIPGARFAIRSKLVNEVPQIGPARLLVLTSPDSMLAHWAASDLRQAGITHVRVLKGGTQAWTSAGLDLEADYDAVPEPGEDVWFGPYDFKDKHQSMTDYLQWEVDLLDRIRLEAGVRFSCKRSRVAS